MANSSVGKALAWDTLYYDPVVQMSELIYQFCMVELRVRLSAQGMEKTNKIKFKKNRSMGFGAHGRR